MTTLRRQGEWGHFWTGGVIFASQFEESDFDMSLLQWVLFVIMGGESGTSVRVKGLEHSSRSSQLSDPDCSGTSALTIRLLYLPHRGFTLNCVFVS